MASVTDGAAANAAAVAGKVAPAVWTRGALQLSGAYLLAVLLPFATAAAITPVLLGLDLFAISLLASMAAITVGFWLFRNLVAFPGIRASYYVLPVFSSTFALAVAVLFMARANYSRPLLIASFGLSVLWFYVVYFMIQRRRELVIAVVPFGRAIGLYGLDPVSWVPLSQPRLPLGCSRVAADFEADLPAEWVSFMADCALAGVSVVHHKQLRESLTGEVQIERLSENAFGTLDPSPVYMALKRVGDAVGTAVLLPLLLPLLLAIALVVRLDSRGPAIFRQDRIGYRGRPFSMWKFRTMTVAGAPAPTVDRHGPTGIVLHDPARITRVGRWLRRSRLDELPQLVNVLRGDMSLIGPRPEAIALSHWYQDEIPFYRYRHIVRPGITGWAQVNQGHVATIDEVLKKLSYDFFYVSRFTFWIDVLIVVRTVKTMITGFGSR